MAFTPTTINTLRTSSTLNTTDEYYVTDPGMEGFWKLEGLGGYAWMDNLGTVLYNITGTGNLVKRIYDSHVNVKWFGAMGDGNTDDTIAIQNAIDFMQQDIRGNGTLYFPTGIYRVSQLIIAPSNENGLIYGKITILGDGLYYSIFLGIPEFTLADHCDVPDPGLTITPKTIFTIQSPFVTLKNIGIQGSVYVANQCYQNFLGQAGIISLTENTYEYTGISLETGSGNLSNHFILENTLLRTCEVGLKIRGSFAVKINECMFGGIQNDTELTNTCNYGITIDRPDPESTPYSPDMVTITDTSIYFCKKWGITYQGATALILRGVILETNGNYNVEGGEINSGAIKIYGTLNYNQNTCNINISECWFEANAGYNLYCVDDQNMVFNFFGCNFVGDREFTPNNRYFGVHIDLSPTEGDERKIVNVIGCFNSVTANTITTGPSFILHCSTINLVGSILENLYYTPSTNILGNNQTNFLGTV